MPPSRIIIPIALVTLVSAAHRSRAQSEALYAAVPGRVIKLIDLNADGDFLDGAEQMVFADNLPLGDNRLASDGGRLFLLVPATAEVLVIRDVNGNGNALDFAEVLPYADFTAAGTPAQLAGLSVAADGTIYTADAANGLLFAVRDANGDGDALDFAETLIVADGLTNPSAIAARPDGSLLVTQTSTEIPVRILEDRNQDGDFLDFAENISYVEDATPGSDLFAPELRRAFITLPDAGEIVVLHDRNGDDDALDFAEVALHAAGLPSPSTLTSDGLGGIFIATRDNVGAVYRARDANSDGDALDFAETVIVAEGLIQSSGIVFIAGPTIDPCLKGDINNDATVDIGDATDFVQILIGLTTPPQPCPADLNSDGRIDGHDIQPLIDQILP